MPIASTYNTGTASISANSTAVTGQSTTWLTSGIKEGDLFWAAGLAVRIASINSNTSVTLAYPWPGTTRATDSYEIRFTPDATRVLASARQLIDMLGGGVIAAIAVLATGANKLAYFTGAGAAALTDLTAHGRAIIGLSGGAGKFIRSTGTNTAVLQDMVGTVAQSAGVPTGAIIERGSNANGEYVRFADGTQICRLTEAVFTYSTTASLAFSWSFPAAFSAAPSVQPALVSPYQFNGTALSSAVLLDGGPIACVLRTVTGTAASLNISRAGSNNWISSDTLKAELFAFGRWY